ncbi:helix-turn-helix domain-containing protein (plasmid) [Streptomyces sp. NBC_01278]|uniref:helix-turn-helix domain-containing protein n=1 Tax=Streptomyces sp. NBC_01278 TaxID=2903809 RepID=UPI002E35C78B|nr:helix-turn-helix domain-containing protein [Streptomyces sp. NBC_01278]
MSAAQTYVDDFEPEGDGSEPEVEIVAGRMPDVQFTKVPNWVFLSSLKPQAQALYVHLAMHVNTTTRRDRKVWPTQETLAARLGLSRVQSLTVYFKQLEELGAIDMELKRYAGNMRQRYKYTVHLLPPEGYEGPMTQGDWYDEWREQKEARKKEAAAAQAPAAAPVPADPEPAEAPAARHTRTRKAPAGNPKAKAERKPAAKKSDKSPQELELDGRATAGAEWWWGKRATKDNPNPEPGRVEQLAAAGKLPRYVGNKSSAYHATRTMIRNALKAGYDRGTIAKALENGGRAFPSQQQFEDACARASGVSIDRKRGAARQAPAYDDDAIWGAQKRQKARAPQPSVPDDDEFGLRDLANPA